MEPLEASAAAPAELALRLVAGDAEAEAALVERYARGVRNLLARHTRDADVAEELFQETFCLAAAKLRAGELRDPARLPGFLAGLARNLAIEHYRKETRRQTEVDSEVAERAVAATAAGQLSELLRGEEAGLVRRVLAELHTPRDREVLFRFYIAEEERERIAADLGMSEPQLNRVLHRARQRYRDLYLARTAAVRRAAAGLAARLLVTLASALGATSALAAALRS